MFIWATCLKTEEEIHSFIHSGVSTYTYIDPVREFSVPEFWYTLTLQMKAHPNGILPNHNTNYLLDTTMLSSDFWRRSFISFFFSF